jgi:prolyl oligopeptidase
VESGKDLPDVLEWIKFSGVSWLPDGSGFYYSRYDQPKPGEEFTGVNYFQKLFFHAIGTDQSADTLVYERPDEKEWGFDGEVSENGEYLIVSIWKGTLRKNQVLYRRLDQPDSPFVELLTGFDALYGVVHAADGKFVVVTDKDAPAKKVVEIDLAKPAPENWRTLIEESERPIESVDLVGGTLFVSRLADAKSEITLYDREGELLRQLELPGIGTTGGFEGRSDDKQTFYYFTSFAYPTTIFRFDLETDESEVFRAPHVDFDPTAFATEQIFATSKDGTRVPIFVTRKKDVPLDGRQPTILYGYGGFDISLTPSFSVSNLVWLEGGGVYAVANLRGGGEYGRTWHEGGMLANKQNVFDDFLAAAEKLIEGKYASRETLSIRGGSNGGLLVGAAMTQRPELFAAAAPAVGVMDMLRFHKFTIGWGWVNEYGSSDDPEQFRWLHAYSPYHNLREGVRYPATLVTTGDHDDRVVPAHSFKFAAELQHCQAPGGPPVLIRIETSAGHGAGKPISKTIEEAADVLSFLGSRTGWRGPK